MTTSDSEDFESADEGAAFDHPKKTTSTAKGAKKTPMIPVAAASDTVSEKKDADGWGDFDIDESAVKTGDKKSDNIKTAGKNDGWDDFEDWGNAESNVGQPEKKPSETSAVEAHQLRSVADRLSAIGDRQESSGDNSGSGWGWGGWVTSISNHVSQGISTVTTALESGIGAPDPEEMAKKMKEERQKREIASKDGEASAVSQTVQDEGSRKDEENVFGFGNLMSSVSQITKLVETTGTKVIHGGLDTLENIGKKTMQVLQEGDPGLAKKRAMLGLDPGEKPVLSQILREAKERADEEDLARANKKQAKEVHYETLFDDFAGLVHLEALEMLSKESEMKIQTLLLSMEGEQLDELKETLSQVKELCELPEDDEEEEDESIKDDAKSISQALAQRLTEATQDIGTKTNFNPIVTLWEENLEWLLPQIDGPVETPPRGIFKRAISCLAHTTALSVEIYHKTAEMMLVKNRRSTADEADGLTQLTTVLTRHISSVATLFTQLLGKMAADVEKTEEINPLITNIFLEAGNSSTYIQDAFQLTLPILQRGAT